jgi:hypothetical protein
VELLDLDKALSQAEAEAEAEALFLKFGVQVEVLALEVLALEVLALEVLNLVEAQSLVPAFCEQLS